MAKIDHANIGDVAKTKYLMGTIVSTDSENDTCEVAVTGIGVQSGVPIFYHCEAASVTRANGALEGGSGAFAADDEVIVQNKDGELKVIGFADGEKKPCAQGWQFRIRDWDFNNDADVIEALFIAKPSATPYVTHLRTILEFHLWFDNITDAWQVDYTRNENQGLFELTINQFHWRSSTGIKTLTHGIGDDLSFVSYTPSTGIVQVNTKHPSYISQIDLDIPVGNEAYYGFGVVNFRYEGPSNPPGFQNVTAWVEYPDATPVFGFNGELITEGPVYTYPWENNFLVF